MDGDQVLIEYNATAQAPDQLEAWKLAAAELHARPNAVLIDRFGRELSAMADHMRAVAASWEARERS